MPAGMNENSHIKVSRCVVAMVAATNHATLKVLFSAKILPLKSKNKLVWFLGLMLQYFDVYKRAKIDR